MTWKPRRGGDKLWRRLWSLRKRPIKALKQSPWYVKIPIYVVLVGLAVWMITGQLWNPVDIAQRILPESLLSFFGIEDAKTDPGTLADSTSTTAPTVPSGAPKAGPAGKLLAGTTPVAPVRFEESYERTVEQSTGSPPPPSGGTSAKRYVVPILLIIGCIALGFPKGGWKKGLAWKSKSSARSSGSSGRTSGASSRTSSTSSGSST